MNNVEVKREWHHIDAEGKVLGRIATEVATLLRGKHKVTFRRHNDEGDIVVITNAAKVVLTGNKLEDKKYIHHTGYPTGFRSISAKQRLTENPTKILESAVFGMLPKTRQRDAWMKRLHIYADANHPHTGNISPKSKTKE